MEWTPAEGRCSASYLSTRHGHSAHVSLEAMYGPSFSRDRVKKEVGSSYDVHVILPLLNPKIRRTAQHSTERIPSRETLPHIIVGTVCPAGDRESSIYVAGSV